jgi:adenylate cyclase
MTEPARQQGFFAELNRRNVFRVGMAYVLVAWIVLQIADVLFPALTLPEWTTRLVAGLLLLGFPLALFFAWAFELTPDGLKREADVPREESITHKTRRKLDFVVVGVLLVALALMLVDKFVWQASDSAPESVVAAANGDKSIAVLPFANMSDDPSNEYFSDGITEELLNLLAKVPELRVIGRTSSFQFKNKNEDLRVIGEKLGVTNILEGSVRKSGNTVRVTAQLINSSDGAHLWSDTFDRDLDDIFKVQDEIAQSVVETLKVKLLGAALPQRKQPTDREAYDLYLKGRYFYVRLGVDDVGKAEDYFEKAVQLDPQSAPAWDGLAAVYIRQILNGVLPPEEGQALVWHALDRAIELDPTLSVTHYRVGFIRMIFDWNWPGAEEAFAKALAIEPNFPDALSGTGLLKVLLGQNDTALDFVQRSLRVDPLRPSAHHNIGFVNYQSGNYAVAIDAFREALEMSGGTYTRGNYYLSLNLLALGELQAALRANEKETGEQWRLAGRSVILHALNRADESDVALKEMSERFADKAAFVIAGAHAYRGEIDEAFNWLDRAYEQHDPLISWIMQDPLLQNLHRDPRYSALLEKLNLSQ